MNHTIKFRKSMLTANWAGDYSVISDTSIMNKVYSLTKHKLGVFKIKKLKIRKRYSDLRSKVVIYSTYDCEWNEFVVAFLKAFDGYIEDISIK